MEHTDLSVDPKTPKPLMQNIFFIKLKIVYSPLATLKTA
ncbi:MAG: hypothetical protein H6Q20_2565 [Bacteroidetes bacterium]|nr:hypothetical protein [Bacteroidota bacterium]